MPDVVTEEDRSALEAEVVLLILDQQQTRAVIRAAATDGAVLAWPEVSTDGYFQDEVAFNIGEDTRGIPDFQFAREIVGRTRNFHAESVIRFRHLAIVVWISQHSPVSGWD